MIFQSVFQGSSVFPRFWGDASMWPGVWPRPTTDHPRQPSTHPNDKPTPQPQLSHSVEVLLQRQLWLEGILRGEPVGARVCVCVCLFACTLYEHEARHINSAHTNRLSCHCDGIDLDTHTHTCKHLNTPKHHCNLFHQISKDWLVSVRVSLCLMMKLITKLCFVLSIDCTTPQTFPSPSSPFLLPLMNGNAETVGCWV